MPTNELMSESEQIIRDYLETILTILEDDLARDELEESLGKALLGAYSSRGGYTYWLDEIQAHHDRIWCLVKGIKKEL